MPFVTSGGNDDDIEFDGPAVYANDQNGSPLYKDGPGIVNAFRIVEGVFAIPVAEAPPTDPSELAAWSPVEMIRLHSPYRIRKTAFASTKQTRPPVMPSPGSEGKFEFIGGDLGFSTVPNGPSFDWSCQSEYVYVENCVSRTIDGFVLGMAPFQYPEQKQGELYAGNPTISSPGAISEAGSDARRGFSDQNNGPNNYTAISFFPGLFFNSEIANGGLGSSPQQFNESPNGGVWS